ncbi:MAG: Crp/Fnr family transcriptional regulator [Anaerovoracaceae bacterium]|jgi:CRP/FNR family cyclic AMP-dependent transcriptional regulator
MRYLETIIGSGLFSKIKKSDYIRTFEELSVSGRRLKKGYVIYDEGDLVDRICILKYGTVRGEKAYTDGDLHIIHVYDKGSLFALEAAVSERKTSPINYICSEDSTVVSITMASIYRSNLCEEILTAIMEKMASDNIKKMHKIEILAQRGLRDRLLMYFSLLEKKDGDEKGSFILQMGREELAQFLSVNRSALSNELNKMKREGVLEFNKGTYRLL